MSRAEDRTGIILPRINQALARAGRRPARVVLGEDGASYLSLPSGGRLRIRQLGALTPSMLPAFGGSSDPGAVVVWCRFVGEALAGELGRRGFCYADTAGNMLLRFGGSFLQVRNCPKPRELSRDLARGRSLTPSGLKVLFLLLTEPEAVRWSYRRIADSSGVAAGAVNYAMADLRDRRRLLEDDSGRRLADTRRLGRLWVDNYLLRLLPRLKTTRYSGRLMRIDGEDDLVAGGETAARREGLLATENIVLWDQKHGCARTAARNRWHLDRQGNIEVREAFWPGETRRFLDHVPWLLVYADLLATEDGRCFEAAEEIRRRHLEGLA